MRPTRGGICPAEVYHAALPYLSGHTTSLLSPPTDRSTTTDSAITPAVNSGEADAQGMALSVVAAFLGLVPASLPCWNDGSCVPLGLL